MDGGYGSGKNPGKRVAKRERKREKWHLLAAILKFLVSVGV